MTVYQLSDVQKAVDLASTDYRVDVAEIEDQKIKHMASQVTPDYFDDADIFYLLSHPENIVREDQAASLSLLRSHMDLPQADPEGVSLNFGTVNLNDGVVVAKTVITPDNKDDQKDPIVFAGGLFHNTGAYFDFLTKLAIESGREICAFDSPGIGGSRFDQRTLDYDFLAESFPAVIKSQYDPEQSVAVMGHSMGSLGLRYLYNKQEGEGLSLVANPVSKYVFVAPVPSPNEYNYFSIKYMLDGVKQMVTNGAMLEPGKYAREFYFSNHNENDWQWMNEHIGHEKLKVNLPRFAEILLRTNAKSVKKNMQDSNVAYVMMENDHVFESGPKRQERAIENGAYVIKGADHSAIAGPNVSDSLVEEFTKILDDRVD